MRLSTLVPTISAEAVKFLESSRIRTDVDLLFTPTEELYKRLPRGTVTLQDLTRLCTTVTELTAAKPILANEFLLLEQQRVVEDDSLELCVGDEALDNALEGLGGRRVIEISGDRSSGKSVRLLGSS